MSKAERLEPPRLGRDDFHFRLLEALEQALIATDLQGRIVYWNRGAEELYGWASEEVLGKSVLDVTPAPEMRAHAARIMAELGAGGTWTGEFRTRRKDGSIVLVSVTDTPITDGAGTLIGVAGVSTDLSERKAVEKKLREEAQLVDTLHRIGGVLTAELDLRKVVQTVIDAATALTGARAGAFLYNVQSPDGEPYTLATISGESGRDPSRPALPPLPADFLERALPAGGAVRREQAADHPAPSEAEARPVVPGMRLPVASYLAVPVVSRAGETAGGLFFGHEIPGVFTERHERIAVGIAAWAAVAMDNAALYEAEQRARSGAEAANRAKSDFLAVMSHELRTPLGAILGYTDILNLRMAGPITEEQEGHLARIKASARHLLYLIDEVLTYARMEAGKETLRLQTVDLGELVEEVQAMIEPLAAQHELSFTVHLPPEPISLRTDPGKLRQILVNLLTNAVKFTTEGSVRLDVRSVTDGVLLQVRDTGIGISAEHLEQIFEAFWQVDQGITRSVGGTGLGLSVVQRLLHMLGGTISAESEVGGGSVFTVTLPVE